MVAPYFWVPSTTGLLDREMSTVLETSTSQVCSIARSNKFSFSPLPSMCPIRGFSLPSPEFHYSSDGSMNPTHVVAKSCRLASELPRPVDKCKSRNDSRIVAPRLDPVVTIPSTSESSLPPILQFSVVSDGLVTPLLGYQLCPVVTTSRNMVHSEDFRNSITKLLASSAASPSSWMSIPQSVQGPVSSPTISHESSHCPPTFVSPVRLKPTSSTLFNGHHVQSCATYGSSGHSQTEQCAQRELLACWKSHPKHSLHSTVVYHPSVSFHFSTSSTSSSHESAAHPSLSCISPGNPACGEQTCGKDEPPPNMCTSCPINSLDRSTNFTSSDMEPKGQKHPACQRHARNCHTGSDNLCYNAIHLNYRPSFSHSQIFPSTCLSGTSPISTSFGLTHSSVFTQGLSGVWTTDANASSALSNLLDSYSTYSEHLTNSTDCLHTSTDMCHRTYIQKNLGEFDSSAIYEASLKRRLVRGCNHHNMLKRRRVTGKGLGLTATSPPSTFVISTLNGSLASDPTHFLHHPVISVPVFLYPPIPIPLREQRRSENDDQCNFVVPSSPVFSTPRKYDNFPLFLNSPTVSSSDSVLCDFLSKKPSDRLPFCEVTRSNFLIGALRRAMYRTSRSRVDSSPLTTTHPLNLHLLSFRDRCSGRITPPLYTNNTNLYPVDRTQPANSPIHSVPDLLESNASSELSSCCQPIVCAYCAMQILESGSGITFRPYRGGKVIVFCSFNCLVTYQKAECAVGYDDIRSTPFSRSVEVSTIQSDNSEATTPSLVILMRRKNRKLNVNTEDRLSSGKNDHRNRALENVIKDRISAPLSEPVWRWNRVRWYRYGKRDRLTKRLPNTAPKFVTDSSHNGRVCLPKRNSAQSIIHPGVSSVLEDDRICFLCRGSGDAPSEIAGRLLQYAFNKWLHLNCILWCYDAYETVGGRLIGVSRALAKASATLCSHCSCAGAGLPCFHSDCQAIYHLPCAHAAGCTFHVDRAMYCPSHRNKYSKFPQLHSLAVNRRVSICRDEGAQVADIISRTYHPSDLQSKSHHLCIPAKLRVGGITLHSIGQLLPEQLASGVFHSTRFIYPVGYSSTRIYWSYRHVRRRCFYHCKIEEACGSQETLLKETAKCIRFVVVAEESDELPETFEHSTCDGVWQCILTRINCLRTSSSRFLRVIQENLSGEFLYGLTEPHIVRAIESLPGVDGLSNYIFKFGRLQLIKEMPLAINPTGCARSEPKLRTHVRRLLATDTVDSQNVLAKRNPCSYQMCAPTRSNLGSPVYLAANSVGFSKSQLYKRLRSEWSLNVVLARSRIQGLGLFAARDLGKNTYIIEYLGELIRNEVGNRRELLYDSQCRGVYMFRVDDDSIVDATMCGGLARYINHSCEPNCTAEILYCDGSGHIIIVANRDIGKGEELTYDYKFDIEDHGNRIPCLCGSACCRKWMN